MSDGKAIVGILMGSDSDWPVMKKAAQALEDLGVPWEAKVMSAHRTPDDVAEYARSAADRGLDVIIAGAGMAAHLAGVVAAHTVLPVIAVPIKAKALEGMDALLAMVMMPPGVPVATVGVDAGKNAGLLAVQVVGTRDAAVRERFGAFKRQMADTARAKVLPPL